MINTNDVYKIADIFSGLFFYGLARGHSFSSIEERIVNSGVVRELENGDSSFLYQRNPEDIAKDIFDVPEDSEYLMETDALSLWLGFIYTKLFFSKNKSFSYLFLYFPLEKAVDAFDLYHEMDISQLLKEIDDLEKNNTILTLLLKKRGMKMRELSAITRININTIVAYKRNNENIYNGKYQYIYDISSALKVNPNIFIKRINNFTNSQMFDFDKSNPIYRLYLAYYLACCFDNQIAEEKFERVGNSLKSDEKTFSAIWTDAAKNGLYTQNENKEIESLVKKFKNDNQNIENTTLVVFEFNQISEEIDYYLKIKQYGFEKIVIINQCYYFMISQNKHLRREITDTINEACIRHAKEAVNGDFAV